MKHIVIIGVEILLLFAIIFGFLMAAPSIARSQNNEQSFSLTNIASIYKQALISPFAKASAEIKDPRMAGFFKELVTSMELDKPATVTEGQPETLANVLPDIQKINKAALTTPLVAAGKQIQDKEIADFYQSFLKQCGVIQ